MKEIFRVIECDGETSVFIRMLNDKITELKENGYTGITVMAYSTTALDRTKNSNYSVVHRSLILKGVKE